MNTEKDNKARGAGKPRPTGVRCCKCADDQNLRALPHICAWVYNRLRAPHGSEAAYNEHLEAMRAKKERQA